MATFDELENPAPAGTKLARRAWGDLWVEAPIDRSSLEAFATSNVLMRTGGTLPWADIYGDTAEADWEIVP